MQHRVYPSLFIIIVAIGSAGAAHGVDGTPEQCRRLEQRIEKYTELRRGGGSGSKMAAWKRARIEAKEAHRSHNCHRQGSQMIRISGSK